MSKGPEIIRVLSLNVHKGFSALGRRFVLHELKDAIVQEKADIVFLQEVIGESAKLANRIPNWSGSNQYEFLADSIWKDHAYGKNAVSSRGHHGNAILSHYPILRWHREDISAHPLEQRGFLHAEIAMPDYALPLQLLCVHFGLLKSWRRKQFADLRRYLEQHIAPDSPLIVAGDFNDWTNEAKKELCLPLQLVDAYASLHGRAALTFPAALPLLSMDKIFVRQAQAQSARVLSRGPWRKLSDHAAITVDLYLAP